MHRVVPQLFFVRLDLLEHGIEAVSKYADLVIGFNIRRFDYKVLRGYTDSDLSHLITFDILDAIQQASGTTASTFDKPPLSVTELRKTV